MGGLHEIATDTFIGISCKFSTGPGLSSSKLILLTDTGVHELGMLLNTTTLQEINNPSYNKHKNCTI